jgi:hypothetical protein
LIAAPTCFLQGAVADAELLRDAQRRLVDRDQSRERILFDRNDRCEDRDEIVAEHACKGLTLDSAAPDGLHRTRE